MTPAARQGGYPHDPRRAYVAGAPKQEVSHGDVRHAAQVHGARHQDDQGEPQPAREGQAGVEIARGRAEVVPSRAGPLRCDRDFRGTERRRGGEVRAFHGLARQRAHRVDARVHRGGVPEDHLRAAVSAGPAAPDQGSTQPRRKWLRRGLWALLATIALVIASQVARDVPLDELKRSFAGGASRFVDLDGLSVHYRDEGEGPPMVLLHGTGASLHTWDAWTEALRGHFRVIRMDLPGFGLAGNSLGGQIAWSYAVAHPARVRALVLVDPTGYPIDRPALLFRLARIPGLSWLVTKLDPGPLTEKTLRDAYGDPRKVTPALVERYHMLALREGNRRAFVKRVAQRAEDRSADVGKVRSPTLILWGAQDRLVPVAHAHRFQRAIPAARLIIYDGVGHVPMEEIGERSAADADAFVSAT